MGLLRAIDVLSSEFRPATIERMKSLTDEELDALLTQDQQAALRGIKDADALLEGRNLDGVRARVLIVRAFYRLVEHELGNA